MAACRSLPPEPRLTSQTSCLTAALNPTSNLTPAVRLSPLQLSQLLGAVHVSSTTVSWKRCGSHLGSFSLTGRPPSLHLLHQYIYVCSIKCVRVLACLFMCEFRSCGIRCRCVIFLLIMHASSGRVPPSSVGGTSRVFCGTNGGRESAMEREGEGEPGRVTLPRQLSIYAIFY